MELSISTIFQRFSSVRGDIADMAQSALPGHGNKARQLRGVLCQLEVLENAFEEYLAANRRFAQASLDIEAVQAGREAAMRGRTEDTAAAV